MYGALVFVFVGLAFGPLGLGLLNLSVGEAGLRTLAELTLALVLFTDAANSDLSVLRSNIAIPRRLLLIGLPLAILLGFALGFLMFDELGLLEIAVLASMLAPSDAALGKAVVTNEAVPSPIRQGLNVQSGLNDGICVPILFLFLILATQTVGEQGTHLLGLKLVAEEIGIGVAVGVVLTLAGAWTLRESAARGWVTESWRQECVPALALVCFTTAQYLGGSGVIACFVGDMLFGWRAAARCRGHGRHAGDAYLGGVRSRGRGQFAGIFGLECGVVFRAEFDSDSHVAGVHRHDRDGFAAR